MRGSRGVAAGPPNDQEAATAIADAQTKKTKTSCLGDRSAPNYLIYLHGMDTPTRSAQEQQNRALLTDLAEKLNLRIALPRATNHCPVPNDGLPCWGWSFSVAEINAAAPIVDAAAKDCFPRDARYGFLGFSNGGYYVLGAYRACMWPGTFANADWAVLVGSARAPLSLPQEASDLSSCGEVVLMSGDADTYNSDLHQQMIQHLLSRDADAREVTHSGGHELPPDALGPVVQEQFGL